MSLRQVLAANRAFCTTCFQSLCWVLLAFGWTGISAQESNVKHFIQEGEKFVALSTEALPEGVSLDKDVVFSVETFGRLKRITAKGKDVEAHSSWTEDSVESWVVYSETHERFQELENRLKLKDNNSKALKQFLKSNPDFRYKEYPAMGYAVLWFPKDENPVELANELTELSEVQDVQLEFKKTKHFAF